MFHAAIVCVLYTAFSARQIRHNQCTAVPIRHPGDQKLSTCIHTFEIRDRQNTSQSRPKYTRHTRYVHGCCVVVVLLDRDGEALGFFT